MATSDVLYYFLFLIWFITALVVHYLVKTCFKHRSKVQPPPTPLALPFIGHLHLIGAVLPKSFQSLAQRYGPLMQIQLGASRCIIVSNAAVAKEMLKAQETNFMSRPEFGTSEHFLYRGSRFIMAPYGDYWRFMKKLCMTRLLAVPQLEKFVDVREEEVAKLVESVLKTASEGKVSNLKKELTTLTNNISCSMAMSTRCSGTENEADEIVKLVEVCLKLAARMSAGDVLGPLKWIDNISGNGQQLESAMHKFDLIVERIMKEHEDRKASGSVTERKDLMDILLEVYNDPTAEVKLTRTDIKSFFLDIFMAGTDTSSSAMQWAMAELINNPQFYKRLREEIESVVGCTRLVRESDVPNLPYLQAVIRETLRLHPSAPLIIRECEEDTMVNGYLVEAKSRVLVNVYSIMRDPEIWTEPEKFTPERFLEDSDEKIGEHQMEFKGQNFRYLPFGSGRRGCPGASLAMLMMHAAIGALVQCFDWELMEGEKKVDLTLGPGFASEMAKPLVCCPVLHLNPFKSCS